MAEFEDQQGVTRFIPLNGVPTKIVIYDDQIQSGNDIETPFNYDRLVLMISGKLLIKVILGFIHFSVPGNPGEVEYYRNYLARVHQMTKLPVIAAIIQA